MLRSEGLVIANCFWIQYLMNPRYKYEEQIMLLQKILFLDLNTASHAFTIL